MAGERDQHEHVLLLDAGDALIGGGILGDESRGAAVVDGMRLMDYDAMAIGPKDLSIGLGEIRERMAEAEFPMLSANVVLAADGSPLTEPYTVLEVAGHRIGVIGLTRVPDSPMKEFDVQQPRIALEAVLPEVAAQAGTIVVLTNIEEREVPDLVGGLPDIDLVIAGLPDFQPSMVQEVPAGPLYVSAEQARARHSGRRVGRLTLDVGSAGDLDVVGWQTLPMDKTLVDDPEMDALMDDHYRIYWGEPGPG